jgi:hypothetical protein
MADWSDAYFPPAQPAFTGTDPGMGYYDALAGKPGDASTPAWGDKLTKALGDLSKGANAQQGSGSGGQSGQGAMAPAQSGIGGGGGASQLAALVQLLAQRYQQLYPGGGSSKGLLGV